MLKWCQRYLEERVQSVVIDGVELNIWLILQLFGISQGSVLGPILFIIYTSPLADILHHHGVRFHFYADDSQLYRLFDIGDNDETIFELE